MKSTFAHMLGTCCGVGHLRPAPGTWGSAVTLPVAWGLHTLGGYPLVALTTIAASVAGFWAAAVMTKGKEDLDPSEFVLDEFAGQIFALWALSLPAWLHGIPITALWPGWIAAFVLFRLFDIWKPGPVGWADRRKGPFGVMVDDLIAGAFAGLGTVALAGIYHGLLGG